MAEESSNARSQEEIVDRMLHVIERDVLPLTRSFVEKGNKLFGAAVLKKSTLELVVAGTNREVENPLFHGEVSCINELYKLPAESRPSPSECLFLATHEPCSLCLSAITWCGFNNFYYLFTYEDTRDAFQIPHDLRILEEVFKCTDGGYAANNSFWSSHSIRELVRDGSEEKRSEREAAVMRIERQYATVSARYEENKLDTTTPTIPLS